MKRLCRIELRVSEAEYNAIYRRARKTRRSVSEHLREAGLTGKIQPLPSINTEQWAKLAATTANLNQLTRKVNEGRLPYTLEVRLIELRKVLEEVRRSLLEAR